MLSEEDANYWILSFNGAGDTVLAAINANAVPEPATWIILLLGAVGLLYGRKK
ncbi:MAG: PEP-CTERM sorting domain-containing protein [Thermoguttaceae bacterium]|nr:PEP-CTERM sorting domain-containing protein [Thermoguttaceae bacterium]